MLTFSWLSDLRPFQAAAAVWADGTYSCQTVFHSFYKSEGPFSIAAGAGLLAEHVRRFRFSPDVMADLGRITDEHGRSVFSESFLNHLQRMTLVAEVYTPPEGMLLLPGEPILIARGALDQILMLESAFRVLVWESTHWATQAALQRWQRRDWHEEDTPRSPQYAAHPTGWKVRALYIGGAATDEILAAVNLPTRPLLPDEGLKKVWQQGEHHQPTMQIRRLYNVNRAVGDIFLNDEQNRQASVSRTTVQYHDMYREKTAQLTFTRFQNLYAPVLAKGNSLLISMRKGYFRQRTLHQMEAFSEVDFNNYPTGYATDG